MERHITLLEERVSRAVKRLRDLEKERKRLESELRSLRGKKRVPSQERPLAVDGESDERERRQVVESIREALGELRGD